MSSFTDTFGGSSISPSQVSYAAYSFSTALVLFWPAFSAGNPDVAARFMNLTATANSLNVFMPDATLISVGQDSLIFNAGTDTFNVVNYSGGAIAAIAAGQAYYIILNNNSTQAGTWQVVQFGVGTGSAVASALAGAGLLAAGGILEQNILGTTLAGSTTITTSARAVLQVWNGGSGTITLPSSATVGNGFFFPFANDGSGAVTILTTGGEQIDGGSTSIFNQSQSAFIVSTGTAWFTVGKGLQNNFSVTVLNLNVAGSSNVTETSAQAQNIIQQFTGALTGDISVNVPTTPQIYYLYNNTTGSHTLTFKTTGGTGVAVAQGTNTLVYCDGTNIVGAFSSSFGSSITLPVGSAGSPTLNFTGSTSTGLYSPSTGTMAITAMGNEVILFSSAVSSVNYLGISATATANAPTIAAAGSDTNIGIALIPKGTGIVSTTTSFSGPLTGNVTGNLTGSVMGNVTGNLTGNVTGNVTGNITGSAPAGLLTGTTLASNVVTSSLVNFGGTGSATWNFTNSNSGGASFAQVLNNNTAIGTQAIFAVATGSSNSYTDISQIDGPNPTFQISTGSGTAGGIVIDGSAASSSAFVLHSGSGGFTLNSGTGSINAGNLGTGGLVLTSVNSTNTLIITDTGVDGVGIKFIGNGSTTPAKWIRTYNGALQVINSAYTSTIFSLSDTGQITSSTWQATAIASNYGGTGIDTSASTGIPIVTSGTWSTTTALPSTTTATTQASNNSTTKVATTAFVNPGSVQSTSGYCILPSGLYLQWGQIAGGAATGTTTFPIAFPNACFVVTGVGDNSASGNSHFAVTSSPGKTTFAWAGSNTWTTIYWQAIGN